MSKKTWIILISVVVLAGAVSLFIWWRMEEARWNGFQEEEKKEEQRIVDAYAGNKKELLKFYDLISRIYTQIDSTQLQELVNTSNGKDEYLAWLKSHKPYNFRFFPYEIMYQAAHKQYNDSIALRGDWPFTVMYAVSWSELPVPDSNLVYMPPVEEGVYTENLRKYHPEEVDRAVESLPDAEKDPYLHIIYRVSENTTDYPEQQRSFMTRTGPHEYMGTFSPGEFDGFLIVYHLKKMEVVKVFHLQFKSSESIGYSIEAHADQYEKDEKFRQEFESDLWSNCKSVLFPLISDSLQLPEGNFTMDETNGYGKP